MFVSLLQAHHVDWVSRGVACSTHVTHRLSAVEIISYKFIKAHLKVFCFMLGFFPLTVWLFVSHFYYVDLVLISFERKILNLVYDCDNWKIMSVQVFHLELQIQISFKIRIIVHVLHIFLFLPYLGHFILCKLLPNKLFWSSNFIPFKSF
jgi:hypothetical protein